MSSVSCCTICNSISLFPSRPIPHHPTSSHLSHHSYIFISLGFKKPTLSDLIKLIAPYCKGNKYFRQDVLTALSFSGLLHIPGHDVQNLYLPDCQERYSKHFMSNEWAYPMRFWNEQFHS